MNPILEKIAMFVDRFIIPCGRVLYPEISTCKYVNKLIPPNQFRTATTQLSIQLDKLQKQNRLLTTLYAATNSSPELMGTDRYADEHWIGSHPSIIPCDINGASVCDNKNTKNKKKSNQQQNVSRGMAMAPRCNFMSSDWHGLDAELRNSTLKNENIRKRDYFLLAGFLFKWIYLYNETPPMDSWVYDWFPDGPYWKNGTIQYSTRVFQVLTEQFARKGARVRQLM